MKDFLIWRVEKLQKVIFGFSDEFLMAMAMGEIPGVNLDVFPSYSVDAYLKDGGRNR